MIIQLSKETENEEKLGNKGKFLLQMKKQGFRVPGGFILDSDVYDETIAENGLEEQINQLLEGLTAENVSERSKELQALLNDAKLPDNVLKIMDAYADAD